MYKIIPLLLTCFFILNGQTKDQIKKQIINSGLTIEQAKKIANQRGLNYEDRDLEPYVDPLNDNNIPKNISFDDSVINKSENETEKSIISVNNQVADDLQYYGYNIFQADPTTFQSSTFGSIDPNYNIGPGYQIIVMLWGESQFRQEFIINREGYVFIPEVGQVFVNGLDLKSLEKKFFQILSKVYSTLNPSIGKPTTFMDVSLGELRPLRIIVLGELLQPGAYSVNPATSLSSSLYYFNGPSTFGSLREIRLIRKGKYIGDIDFYNYLLSGNVPNDIRLQMDDVIFIPPRGKTVTIKGQINRQGIYEVKEGENLNDLIKIAGNLSVSAYTKRAQISRIIPEKNRDEMGMDRMITDFNLLTQENIKIYDGDIIEIFSIGDIYSNYVSINSNSVLRPGKYQLTPGMKLQDLISLSDGLLMDAYMFKGHIKRLKDDLTFELISFNLEKLYEGDEDQNIELKFMDEIFIFNANELNNAYQNILLSGPVKRPGSYSLLSGGTISDLILL